MTEPTDDYSYLWHGLPYEERKRLIPYMIESKKLHIWQCKQKAIAAHNKHMKELDELLKTLDNGLKR